MKAPFPWFGGKRRVAHVVWSRLGDVATYNEPFAGSLAVLLERPTPPRIETVNDLDCYLANFWRALQQDPDGVARHADSPVNEADLHARHRWLVEVARPTAEKVMKDPDFYDVKIAGWWVWGQCLWIGSGWCQRPEWSGRASAGRTARGIQSKETHEWKVRPHLTEEQGINKPSLTEQYGRAGYGVDQRRRPQLTGDQGMMTEVQRTAADRSGENPHEQKKRPALSGHGGGVGIHSSGLESDPARVDKKRPKLRERGDDGVAYRRWQGGGQAGGSGVHAPSLSQQVPQLSDDGSGAQRGCLSEGVKSIGLYEYMRALSARLRRVRVCCGDWERVLTPSVTTYIGIAGVFLDPPYDHDMRERCYSEDHNISAEVREWAIANGDNPKMRIALCGYEGEHKMPETWDCVRWKANGGYSRSERGRANRDRERIWFSPHCLKPDQAELFK